MHCTKKLTEDIFWIGGNDRRLELFENIYPIPEGVSYNSYLLLDEKTVLIDTADEAIRTLFFENLFHTLGDRTLDYIVVNHMEPDHSAALGELLKLYPDVKIVGNSKTFAMIEHFFNCPITDRCINVEDGDTLCTGRHKLHFFTAPMVHWPEAMVTYDENDRILFSADAFGTFGALSGNIFADECDFKNRYLSEARRYYTNIVGKYGIQTTALLNKAAKLDIRMICPLHGYVWRDDLGWFIDKYSKWGSYTPEENGVVIYYGSIYGGTENAANILACVLSDRGIKNIQLYDISKTDVSYLVSEAFRVSTLVFAASTYNGGIFTPMKNHIDDLAAHNLQNRTAAVIENGSWAPASARLMKAALCNMKNINVLDKFVTVNSTVDENSLSQIKDLAAAITESME